MSTQRSFQSSSDRNDPRGAFGFRSIASHAAGETEISDMPGGPARHFCGPTTQTSMPHSSTSTSSQPSAETASTSSSAPASFTAGAISPTGLWMPEGVSDWTTATSSTSGLSASAWRTSEASTASSYGTRTSTTSAPYSRSQSPNQDAYTPDTRFSAFMPGRVSARAAASRPRTASPCISTMSSELRMSSPTLRSSSLNFSRKTGS